MKADRDIAGGLAAYLPVTLTKRILAGRWPEPGQTRVCQTATLFSDITGFTAMSDELASDGPRGAEELNRVLLLTFTGMIDVIHKMGGAVYHFHGDAMSIYFPDEDGQAAMRALACAQRMRQLMRTSLNRVVVNRPPGKNSFFDLTMKIGAGYGRCQETIIGDPDDKMEYVLAGIAVEEAAEAEKQAQADEIVASRSILTQAGLPAAVDYNLLEQPIPVEFTIPSTSIDWDSFDDASIARLITAVTPFVPPTIHERTTSGLIEMAEHRPVTSMFVQFEFLDEAGSGKEGLLQDYYLWANRVIGRFGSQNARLNRVLTGDKGNQLHIMFGAPIAPDAPDQAIRCALALQREHPDTIAQQRIGLAAGKVFACPVGAAKRREYTVVGDVVNLSARLTQVCENGQVLTDLATANRVREWIELKELAPVYLKGKLGKTPVCQPVGERGSQAQLQVFINKWQRPLIGRNQEVELLLGGMDAAVRGVGSVAAVYGSTGVGKTSLLAYGVKHWLETNGVALAGECQQHTTDIPFGPWRSIWRTFLGLSSSMSVPEQVETIKKRTLALVPDCGDDVVLWGEILGLPFPEADKLEELSAEVRQARLFNLVRHAFQTAAADRPLLIILEGLHWADRSSLAFIDELSTNIENHPIFLVFTFRPLGTLTMETLNRPTCLPIILSDLSPKHGRHLLRQLVGSVDLPPAVEQHLGLRSRDGLDSPVNPLFLEEAVNVMMGLGVLKVNGRVQVDESLLAQMQIPDTIHGLLLARIDRLPVAGRDLLQVASVIGRQFNLEPLVSILQNTSREAASALLTDLSSEEITQLMTADPEWLYLFQHAMTHEVAYESLPFARRQTLHAAVADWLLDHHQNNLKPYYPVLAYHYSRANDHEQGLRFALMAADSALDIFANQEAVELYTLAEEHLGALGDDNNWETAVHILIARGEVLRLLGKFPMAIDDANRAIALSTTNHAFDQVTQAQNLLANLKYYQSRYDEVLTITETVLSHSPVDIPDTELARALLWSGLAAASLSNYEDALVKFQKAESICLAISNNQILADVLGGVAFVYYAQKNLEPALKTMLRAVSLSRNYSSPAKIGFNLNNIALIQLNLGLAEEALATLNETAALASDTSNNLLALAVMNRAEVYAYLGRFSQAKKDTDKALYLFSAMDDEFGLAEVYLLLGYEYHSALSEWSEAKAALDMAQLLFDSNPASHIEQQIRIFIGQAKIALATDTPEEADSYLQTAEELIQKEGLNWWLPTTAYFQGRVFLAQSETVAAQNRFRKALMAVDDGGRPEYLPLILLELGLLETDGSKQQGEMLKKCLMAANKRARRLDRQSCYRRAGAVLAQNHESHLKQIGQQFLDQAEKLNALKE